MLTPARAPLAVLVALPLLVAGACGGGGSSNPVSSFNEPVEMAVILSRRDNPHNATEIVRQSRAGLGTKSLGRRTGVELDVRIHPDGKRIVFTRERSNDDETSREIYSGTIDNSTGEERLTGDRVLDDGPCFSPDGTRIVWSSRDGGTRSLWTMDLTGNDRRALTATTDEDADPDWHAAGLVFSRTPAAGGPARLMRFQPDLSGPVAITDGGGTGLGDFDPAITPDGKTVLFVRRLGDTRAVLMSVPLVGGTPTPLGDGTGDVRRPRATPAADRIFVARSRPDAGLPHLRLWSLAPDGSDARLVVPDDRFDVRGFDFVPGLAAAPAADPTPRTPKASDAEFRLLAGGRSRGAQRVLDEADDNAYGIASVIFERRDVAGMALRFGTGLQPRQIAAVEVEVRATLGRIDGDSVIRLAAYHAPESRYDTVLEAKPPAAGAWVTLRFALASLAHVDRNGRFQLEIIGDWPEGDRAELLVDQVLVRVSPVAAEDG